MANMNLAAGAGQIEPAQLEDDDPNVRVPTTLFVAPTSEHYSRVRYHQHLPIMDLAKHLSELGPLQHWYLSADPFVLNQ